MIRRFLAVLALLLVYHAAAVHGFILFLVHEGGPDAYAVDRVVQALCGALLFLLTLPPSRAKYVHREELRGIWEAIEEFDRDLKARKNYAAAAGHALGKVRAAVHLIAWKLSGSPLPAEDPRTTARKVWEADLVAELVQALDKAHPYAPVSRPMSGGYVSARLRSLGMLKRSETTQPAEVLKADFLEQETRIAAATFRREGGQP